MNNYREIRLNCLAAVLAVVSTILNCKVVVFDNGFTIPCATPLFLFTFVIANIISNRYGEQRANNCTINCFCGSFISAVILFLVSKINTSSSIDSAFSVVAGGSWIFTISSLVSYLISGYANNKVFTLSADEFGVSPAISSFCALLVSQTIDSVLFVFLAYGVGHCWIFGKPEEFLLLVASQLITKLVIASIASLVFCKVFKQKNAEDNF